MRAWKCVWIAGIALAGACAVDAGDAANLHGSTGDKLWRPAPGSMERPEASDEKSLLLQELAGALEETRAIGPCTVVVAGAGEGSWNVDLVRDRRIDDFRGFGLSRAQLTRGNIEKHEYADAGTTFYRVEVDQNFGWFVFEVAFAEGGAEFARTARTTVLGRVIDEYTCAAGEGSRGIIGGHTINRYPFSDIDEHPYREAITVLARMGVIAGYGDGRFGPDDTITRAQVAALLEATLWGEEGDHVSGPERSFHDMTGHWAEQVVSRAAAHGFIAGYPDGTFRPNQPVTRQEWIVMLVAALRAVEFPLPPADDFTLDHLIRADRSAAATAPWAVDAVLTAARAGLFGKLGAVEPEAPATRGEVAQLLHEALYRVWPSAVVSR